MNIFLVKPTWFRFVLLYIDNAKHGVKCVRIRVFRDLYFPRIFEYFTRWKSLKFNISLSGSKFCIVAELYDENSLSPFVLDNREIKVQ